MNLKVAGARSRGHHHHNHHDHDHHDDSRAATDGSLEGAQMGAGVYIVSPGKPYAVGWGESENPEPQLLSA